MRDHSARSGCGCPFFEKCRGSTVRFVAVLLVVIAITTLAPLEAQTPPGCPPGTSCGHYEVCGNTYCDSCTQSCLHQLGLCLNTGMTRCGDGRCVAKQSDCSCNPTCLVCSESCVSGMCQFSPANLCFNGACVLNTSPVRCAEECQFRCKYCIEDCYQRTDGGPTECRSSGKTLVDGDCRDIRPTPPDPCKGRCDSCLERCAQRNGEYQCEVRNFRRCTDGSCVRKGSLCPNERVLSCPSNNAISPVGAVCCKVDSLTLVWLDPTLCENAGGSTMTRDVCNCDASICCIRNDVPAVSTSRQCLLSGGNPITLIQCDDGCCDQRDPVRSFMAKRLTCAQAGGAFFTVNDNGFRDCAWRANFAKLN